MNIIRNLSITLFICLGGIAPLHAQEILQLDESTSKRLGIVVTAVRMIDNSDGARFPANTIHSPVAASELIAKYEGVLESWLVAPGDAVAQDDVLARISSPVILDMQNQWLNSEFERQHLAFELEKDEALLAEGIISSKRFMQTQRNYQQAQSSARLVQDKLSLAGFNNEDLEGVLSGNSARGVYLLRSPIAGTLSHTAILAGNYVEPNTSIASITSPDLWLTAQLPARIGAALALGQTLRVEGSNALLTLKQKDFEVDQTTQSVDIYAEFIDTTSLLPGQVVFLIVPPVVNGVLIPSDAVVHSGDETTVYIETSGGFEIRPVQLRPVGGDYLAEEGVRPGEQIVIRGSAILKGIQLGLGGE